MPKQIIVMGVSGCGKSTIGRMIAKKFKLPFLDGDDFHPASNIKKMATGTALNDKDRQPWLEELALQLQTKVEGCVIACSALKLSYREILRKAGQVSFIYLCGDKSTLASRLNHRSATTQHFMSNNLLDSQLNTLENPTSEIDVITLDIKKSPETLVKEAIAKLNK